MASPSSSTDRTGEPNAGPIFQIAIGFMSSKCLFIASEAGLFEKLSEGPATLDELAMRTGVPRRTTRMVADVMVAHGLLLREGDRYANTRLAQAYLGPQAILDLRPFLHYWNRMIYQRWTTFEDAVRQGKGVLGMLKFSPEEQKIFSQGVEAATAAGANALPDAYDFGRHRRMIDLGGGTGSFLKALLRKYPALECTLFEMPGAAAVARQRMAGTSFAEKIRVEEGDFLRDPIPAGHDAFLIANVAHVLPPERNLQLLRRVRERAGSGARVFIVDWWTNPTHTEPLMAAVLAGECLVNAGEGDVYSVEEARSWFEQTGWRLVEHKPLAEMATSLVIAETNA